MFKKSLFAAVAALTFAVGFAPAAQAFHIHQKVVCEYVFHRGHIHKVCRLIIVPHFGGGHHHHDHDGHHHHHHRHHR